MKIPDWLKRRDATVEELQEQLDGARTDLAAATEAVVAARARFKDDPSALKAVTAARQAEVEAEEHVTRAEGMLDEAKAKRAADERDELERKKAELQARLDDHSEEEELLDREVQAWGRVAAARLARREHNLRRIELEREVRRLEIALGGSPRTQILSEFDPSPSVVPVSEALEAQCRGAGDGDQLAPIIRQLARQLTY